MVTIEPEKPIDLDVAIARLQELEKERQKAEEVMNAYLQELGFKVESNDRP